MTVIIVLSILFLICLLYYSFPLIQVCGESMFPTYINGEILVGCRFFLKSRLKKGDVILYYTPSYREVVIKRIDKIKKHNGILYFYCLGDNTEHSHDSRAYGSVSSKDLICKPISQRVNRNNFYK